MGQKVHPKSFRLKVNKTWDAKWFANPVDFAAYLRQDVLIRKFIQKKLKAAQVSKIDIERSNSGVVINVYAAKPGLIIGRGGQGVEVLKKEMHNAVLKDAFSRKKGIKSINLNIFEVDKPAIDAAIIGCGIAADLEKRMPFRRVIKQAMGRAEKGGAKGVKILVSGRLDGAEIARRETVFVGSIPLHTLRADIDYSRIAAQTIFGKIGIKVWVYKGDVFEEKTEEKKQQQEEKKK